MPGARRGCQNNNRNDIAHINLGFFAVLKHVDISNESQFRDIYRFFSISPPKAILERLYFYVIKGKISSADFPFLHFCKKNGICNGNGIGPECRYAQKTQLSGRRDVCRISPCIES